MIVEHFLRDVQLSGAGGLMGKVVGFARRFGGDVRFIFLFFISVFCAACGMQEQKVVHVNPLQKQDKKLSCAHVQLEINEAEFRRKQARDVKAPGLNVVLMPIAYVADYVDAAKAETAADERIQYLQRIYEIQRCDQQPVIQQAAAPRVQTPVASQQQLVPVVYYVPASHVPHAAYQPVSYEQAYADASTVSAEEEELPLPYF
jgi:hypothetical protein